VTWVGLVLGYYSSYPTGVFITNLSFGVYVLARVFRLLSGRTRRVPAAAVPA
jgi:hypothetical protein